MPLHKPISQQMCGLNVDVPNVKDCQSLTIQITWETGFYSFIPSDVPIIWHEKDF